MINENEKSFFPHQKWVMKVRGESVLEFANISSSLTQRKINTSKLVPPLQPRVLEYTVSMKKSWVNPNHQNSCNNEKDC